MMISKPTKIRSKKLTQSARDEVCTLRIAYQCSGRDTVVFCHAPSVMKGGATKSDDFWGAYGCYNCHLMADTGCEKDWLRAIHETQKRLIEKGLIKIAGAK